MIEWHIEPLTPRHDRKAFDCGETSLNTFLYQQANQNAKVGISRTFIATPATALPNSNGLIAGYYTLASGSIDFKIIPKPHSKRLPAGYPIPISHLGRLAVNIDHQSQGLGSILLINALQRVCKISTEIGIQAVTVDALNDNAKRFYQAHGFITLEDDPRHLYLPIATAQQI